MRNVIGFFFILTFALASSSIEFGANDRFKKSLSLINDLQSPYSCTKEPKFSGQCSDILTKLIEDDKKDRLLVFKSMASSCKSRLASYPTRSKEIQDFKSPELLLSAFQANRMEYLGEHSNETIKTCMLRGETKNNDVISKFYHYVSRLNAASGQIAREQIIIDRYLKEKKKTECPNPYLLAAAKDSCEKALNCTNQESIENANHPSSRRRRTF